MEDGTVSDMRTPLKPVKEHQIQKPLKPKPQAFVVDFGEDCDSFGNLQDSFLKYKKGRQDEIREARRMKELELQSRSDPDVMWALRMKFLDQVKKYFGVPYAKKYWCPEDPEYNSPLFLDCCGLVRRAMRDLEDDFGFKIGQWNQAYQYDTLPNTIKEEQMLPGDLVFIAATYFNPKSKKQRHDMVHVEVWLGDGPKTIGARWQKGKVQVFDSYDFVARSYHSQKYIFKSIDTWLKGICKSYCDVHTWRQSLYDPSAKSVFAVEDQQLDQESDADQDAGDTDDELIQSFGDERDFQKLMDDHSEISPIKPTENPKFNITDEVNIMALSENKENASGEPCDADGASNGSGTTGGTDKTASSGSGGSGSGSQSNNGKPVKRSKKSPDSNGAGNPRGAVRINLGNQHPTFYIGGGNGVSLVEGPLLKLGWKRITDKHNEYFKLKWMECKSQINYSIFREGEQLVNHIPNCNLLTNKLGLLSSLQEFSRVSQGMRGSGRIRMEDFVPETYRLDDKGDKKAFLDTFKDGEVWICKPTGMNQGKGIYLISSQEEIDNLIKTREEKQQSHRKTSRPLMTRIIQRYITNPLLLDGHKFDIRAYMHIASTVPYVVLYHKGYIRRTCEPYTDDITNLAVHLTNQFVQKKVEAYKENKDDTVWSMEQFNDYINEKVLPEKEGMIDKDWALSVLPKIMQKIMMYCFNSVKHKLQQRLGYFELFGFDFMVDTDMRVWLIEVNTNPALHTNCEVLKDVLPPIVEESLYIAIECFEKHKQLNRLRSSLCLNSVKNFQLLLLHKREFILCQNISVECFEKKKRSQPLLPIQAVKGYNLMFHDDHRSSGAGSSLVIGPPIVPRCLSSMQRRPKSEEPSKKEVTISDSERKDHQMNEAGNDEDDMNKESCEEEQEISSEDPGEVLLKTTPRSEPQQSKVSTHQKQPVIKKSNNTKESTFRTVTSSSTAPSSGSPPKNKTSTTVTNLTKPAWPSFMSKISPRTLSSGANPMSLTPVTLNATPVSLKMTHVHHEHKRPNTHRTIINKRAGGGAGSKVARSKSKAQDRSS